MRRLKGRGSVPSVDPVSPELLERCKRGDERAWAELVGATHRQVYGLCLRILRDQEDAAEATQDAYVKVFKGLHRYRGDAMFSTWLYRVAANAAISRQRSTSRRRAHETAGDDEGLGRIPAAGSTENEAEARVEVARLEKAIATLPDLYRQPLVLRDIYGLPIDEIARQLGISQTSAKVRIHRARRKLRDALFPAAAEGDGD